MEDKLTDLASGALGGRVLFATDEWFAPAHHLLLPEAPVFLPDEFTDFGKWMDGWETRRKRLPGHDWCLLQLGLRGIVEAIEVDTAFFTGNNAPRASIQAARFPADPADSQTPAALRALAAKATAERKMGVCASPEELALAEQLGSHEWTELVPMTGAHATALGVNTGVIA
jgi:allantoicase